MPAAEDDVEPDPEVGGEGDTGALLGSLLAPVPVGGALDELEDGEGEGDGEGDGDGFGEGDGEGDGDGELETGST